MGMVGSVIRMRRIRAVAVAVALLVAVPGCLYLPSDDFTPGAVDARTHINDLLDQAEAAEAGGDPAAAQALRDQAAAQECDAFGCDAPLGTTTIAMDPALAGGFFNAPWPSDTRLKPDGSMDLTGFPGRSTIPLANIVLGQGEATTFGFGTNSGVFFQATAPVNPDTLPLLAEASIRRRSNAMLFNLDDPSEPPIPVLADTKSAAGSLRPANLVALVPYPGHPLDPSTRYAAVLFDGVRDVDGNRLAPAPIIDQLDGAAPGGVDPADWAQLQQDRDDIIDAVRARTLWHPSELVAFTAFTTQDTIGEMQALADAVAALPTPQVLSRTPDAAPCPPGGVSHTTGRLAMPIWQQGTRPYVNAGGGIVVGPGGLAQQQGVEMGSSALGVLLRMAVPCGPAPAEGWPILLWMSGTGGSANDSPSQLGANVPYAVLSIAPLYSGDRLVSAAPPFNTSDFQFYNYLNPLAGRTNQLQQAADTLYLERIAQNLALAPGEAGGGVDHFDASTVVIAGHSQGSQTIPQTLAVDPSIRGGFMSAGGAGLYHSILHRADVRTLVDGLLGTGPSGELDMFHPYPQVLQAFAEIGDAGNYAPAVQSDVAIYAGLRDGCSSIEVMVHEAEAMGVPIANWLTRRPLFGPALPSSMSYVSPFEPDTVSIPVSENLPGGRTGVMVEVDTGHFGATNYPAIGRSFIDSIAAGGPTVVNPGATPPVAPGSQCPRFDPAPTP
jgi:hypothetical protein